MSVANYLTSESKLKFKIVQEYFSNVEKYTLNKPSIEQPIGKNQILKCIEERKNGIVIKGNNRYFTIENGIVDGYDICYLNILTKDYNRTFISFKLEVDSDLWDEYVIYRKKYPDTTYGKFLSINYPVKSDNWMKNYRFGGIDRSEQIRHVMTQYIVDINTNIIKDYPKQGVLFKDITSVLNDPYCFKLLTEEFIKMIERNYSGIDYFAGLETHGYYLSTILTHKFNKGFIPIRKASKLPPNEDLIKLDYSGDTIGILKDPKYTNKRVLLIDDLIATGGSLIAAKELLEKIDMEVLGSAVISSISTLNPKLEFPCQVFINEYMKNREIFNFDKIENRKLQIERYPIKKHKMFENDKDNKRIISCFWSDYLSESISWYTNIPICDVILKRFNNGETRVEIQENIRNKHIMIVCVTKNNEVNDTFMSLNLILDSCKRSGVNEITVILPYYPYSRSDKKDHPRAPIGAGVIANQLKMNNVDNIFSLDLHSGQTQGFFNGEFHNLYMIKYMSNYIKHNYYDKNRYILVSPDLGGSKRIESYAKILEMNFITLNKKRDYSKPGTVMCSTIIGEHEEYLNKTGIIIDDMADTMGTMVSASENLIKNGLSKVIIIVTHGILSDPAIDRINKCKYIERVIVSNTLPQEKNLNRCKKLVVVDCSELISLGIKNLIDPKGSISRLFN